MNEKRRRDAPAVSDDGVLSALIRFLIQEGEGALLVRFFESLWHDRSVRFEDRLSEDDSAYERLRVLEELLQLQGFDAHVGEDEQGVMFLRQARCPFVNTVAASHLPCQLEEEMLSEVIGVRCSRLCSMAEGDSACVYRFEPELE